MRGTGDGSVFGSGEGERDAASVHSFDVQAYRWGCQVSIVFLVCWCWCDVMVYLYDIGIVNGTMPGLCDFVMRLEALCSWDSCADAKVKALV